MPLHDYMVEDAKRHIGFVEYKDHSNHVSSALWMLFTHNLEISVRPPGVMKRSTQTAAVRAEHGVGIHIKRLRAITSSWETFI